MMLVIVHVIPEMLNVVLHILFSLIVHNNILYQILQYTTANLQKSYKFN